MKTSLKIALAGNPNSGKSTLFNVLTGLNQKVANFPGITVDKKTGSCSFTRKSDNQKITADIIDLPGTYSLYPKTLDERVPFQVLCDPADEDYPDAVIIVADASNIKRSLFLCSQVIDLKIPAVLALNMMDLVTSLGIEIDVNKLSSQLGIPVIPTNALKKEGIEELKQTIASLEPNPVKDFIQIYEYSPCVLSGIRETVKVKSNYAAFQVANNLEFLSTFHINPGSKEKIRSLIREFAFDAHDMQKQETLERYRVINDIVKACVVQKALATKKKFTEKLDNLLTHRVFGYVFFLLILFTIFQTVFSWSSIPMDWIQSGFDLLSERILQTMPPGVLTDLLVNGILAGLSGIIVFVPQIASLFFFIALLEDSGYMARVSFLMDKLMRPFGLNGKSVLPLVSGVACAIPAIMSTRTISNARERFITIFITPLISCSARIPVFTLLISLVIPNRYVFGFLNLQGIVLMCLYMISFASALGSALLLKFVLKNKEKSHFILEMPVYRMPRWSNIALTILEKVKIFLFDAGKVIVAIAIVLWFLSSYGPRGSMQRIESKYAAMEQTQDNLSAKRAEKLENSFAGRIGKTIEPAIRPLGFDWKIGIALITSFAAREVFVGTMATIYSVGDETKGQSTVRDKMLAEINPDTGKQRYSAATGLSLMIFYVFALQCMSTLAVVYRESKSWKTPVAQILYMSGMAYLFSLLVFQLLK